MLLLCRLLGKTVDPWPLKMDADKHVTQYDIGVEQNSGKVVTTTIGSVIVRVNINAYTGIFVGAQP